MWVLREHFGTILHGTMVTLELTAIAFIGALLLGTILAVLRIGPVAPLRVAATGYVVAFRNVPLLVLLVLAVFGLPEAGLLFPLFWTVAVSMALYGAAFVAEAVRSGIATVHPGQSEAARALGLTFSQTLRHAILPQAFRSMIQPLANVLIAIALNSSLAAAVGVTELTGQTELLNLSYAEPIATFGVAVAVYLALTLSTGAVAGVLERRLVVHR